MSELFPYVPMSEDAERAILGALFVDAADCGPAFEQLKPVDFGFQKYADIFEVCREVYAAQGAVDLITIIERLSLKQGYTKDSAKDLILELSAETVSTARIAQHVELVKAYGLRRRFILDTGKLLDLARNPDKKNSEVMGAAESLILSMAEQQVAQGLQPWDTITPNTLITVAKANRKELTGTPTGLRDVDAATGGLQPTDFILLGGRPAMGKTGLGLTMSWRARKRVAFFSMEMGKEQLQQRVFCAYKNLDLHRMRKGEFTQLELDQFEQSVLALKGLPLFIDDANGKTPLQILSQSKRMKAKGGLDLIVVDFCQLGRLDEQVDNRALEVGRFAYALKGIAKELHVPVLGLAQLNREVDKRNGDELGNVAYKLSDFNESGGLEQAADVAMVIHRPEVLSKKAEKGYAQLQVIKYRNGPTGDIDIRFNHESASFSDYVPPSWAEGEPHHERRPSNSRSGNPPPPRAHGDPGPSFEPTRPPRPGEAGWD